MKTPPRRINRIIDTPETNAVGDTSGVGRRVVNATNLPDRGKRPEITGPGINQVNTNGTGQGELAANENKLSREKTMAGNIQKYTEDDLSRYETIINDTEQVTEMSDFLRDEFGIDPELLDFLKTVGVGGIQKLREFYFQAVHFDLKYGTNTTKYMSEAVYIQMAEEHPELFAGGAENAKHGVKHRPSLTSAIDDGLTIAKRHLQKNGMKTSDARFVDLGAGSGKPLIIARHPDFGFEFKKAVGVEYFRGIMDIGQQNVIAAGLDDSKTEYLHGDAAEFTDFNGINVLWSYNSFDDHIMQSVERNLRRHGGKIIAVLNKPLQRDFFVATNDAGETVGINGWTVIDELKPKNGRDDFDPDENTLIVSHGFPTVETTSPS